MISPISLLVLLFLFGKNAGASSPRGSAPPIPADSTSAAAAAAAEAAAAAARARATQDASDQAAAAAAAARASQAAAQAASTTQRAKVTPVAWPTAPSDQLPPFPGPGWRSAVPTPSAVAVRAQQLLPILWQRGAGAHKIELTAGNWTAYRADMMGPNIRGVTAWVPRNQVPASARNPDQI